MYTTYLNEIERFGLIFFIGLAILLYYTLKFLKIFIVRFIKDNNKILWIKDHSFSIELSIWILYLFWILPYFYQKNIIYAIGLSILILLIMFWLGKFSIREIIAGYLIRNNKDLELRAHIQLNNRLLHIEKFHSTYLEGKLETGDSIYIRYSDFYKGNWIRIIENETIFSKTIKIIISSEENSDKVTDAIRSYLISEPYSAIKKKSEIIKTGENNEGSIFSITFYTLDLQHITHIESKLLSRFKAIKN